jgi:hypothetical protein
MASRVRARGARQDEAQDAPSSSDAARGASGASARASDDDGATSVNAELETFIVARYLRRRGRAFASVASDFERIARASGAFPRRLDVFGEAHDASFEDLARGAFANVPEDALERAVARARGATHGRVDFRDEGGSGSVCARAEGQKRQDFDARDGGDGRLSGGGFGRDEDCREEYELSSHASRAQRCGVLRGAERERKTVGDGWGRSVGKNLVRVQRFASRGVSRARRGDYVRSDRFARGNRGFVVDGYKYSDLGLGKWRAHRRASWPHAFDYRVALLSIGAARVVEYGRRRHSSFMERSTKFERRETNGDRFERERRGNHRR